MKFVDASSEWSADADNTDVARRAVAIPRTADVRASPTGEQVEAGLRVAGLALVLAGVSIAMLARGVVYCRERILEMDPFRSQAGGPGSLVTQVGIALLDASSAAPGKPGPMLNSRE
jgi:hypothetical protein